MIRLHSRVCFAAIVSGAWLAATLPSVQIAGGSVAVAPSSASAGFEGGEILGGASISNLWGYTPMRSRAAAKASSSVTRRSFRSCRGSDSR
jgi:hypothetical protein